MIASSLVRAHNDGFNSIYYDFINYSWAQPIALQCAQWYLDRLVGIDRCFVSMKSSVVHFQWELDLVHSDGR